MVLSQYNKTLGSSIISSLLSFPSLSTATLQLLFNRNPTLYIPEYLLNLLKTRSDHRKTFQEQQHSKQNINILLKASHIDSLLDNLNIFGGKNQSIQKRGKINPEIYFDQP